jgi:hypothetical protein
MIDKKPKTSRHTRLANNQSDLIDLMGLIAKPQSGQRQANVRPNVLFYQSDQIKSLSLIDLTDTGLTYKCFASIFVAFWPRFQGGILGSFVRLSRGLKKRLARKT